MKVVYVRRKPKSVEGKGWVFLQEFWKLIVLYLLEKEVNRLIIKRGIKRGTAPIFIDGLIAAENL